MRRLVLPALLLILVRVDAGASARQDLDKIRSAKRVEAVRVDQPIRLDGMLDEPVWERATPAIDFYQQQPAEFEFATRKTEVRFLYRRGHAVRWRGAVRPRAAPTDHQ